MHSTATPTRCGGPGEPPRLLPVHRGASGRASARSSQGSSSQEKARHGSCSARPASMSTPLLRDGFLASWVAVALALLAACGGEKPSGGCPAGQVHCTSCGGAGFCSEACPAYACPGGDGGGADAASGAADAGACPQSTPSYCTDCAGAGFCVSGGCPTIACSDDGGAAGTDGGNPVGCPANPPSGSCTLEGMSCGYHCLGCTCTQGQWYCPGLGCAGGYDACPATLPTEGSYCTSDGCCTNDFSPCWYGGVGGENIRSDCTSGGWHLTSPASAPDAGGPGCGTPGCPSVPPSISGTGGTCTGSLTCDYGIDGSCSCNGGLWTCTGSGPSPCPSSPPSSGAACVYPSEPVLGAPYSRCAYGDRVCGCTAGGWTCC